MSIIILICSFSIFIVGIVNKSDVISNIFSTHQIDGVTNNLPGAFRKAIVYAGYQSVCIPSLCACSGVLKKRKDASKAMFIAFLMNGIALALSATMLLGWYKDFMAADALALPTLYACRTMNIPILYYAYSTLLLINSHPISIVLYNCAELTPYRHSFFVLKKPVTINSNRLYWSLKIK